jgi:hypothetical protein
MSERKGSTHADFSPQAVARAVLRETLQKPYVLYPTAVGVLGGLAAVLLGPSTLFLAPAAVGLALGAGSWVVDYSLRRDRHAAAYLKRLHEAMAGRVDATIARLRVELSQLDYPIGLSQMDQLKLKFEAFRELLRRKLDPAEMTYGRYLGMAEQVFLGGLDNLARISDALKSLGAIDPRHIERRMREIDGDGIESAAQDRELAALAERAALLDRQRSLVDRLLAENEAAMTRIDHVMAAIGGLDTSAGHASMTMESAMDELRVLTERAAAYAVEAPESLPPPRAPARAAISAKGSNR